MTFRDKQCSRNTAAGVTATAVATGPAADMDIGTADGAHASGTSGDSATCVTADGPAVTADGAIAVDRGAGVAAPVVTDDTARKRRRKRDHTTQDSRKHRRRMGGFTATQDGDPGLDPTPDEGNLVGDRGER